MGCSRVSHGRLRACRNADRPQPAAHRAVVRQAILGNASLDGWRRSLLEPAGASSAPSGRRRGRGIMALAAKARDLRRMQRRWIALMGTSTLVVWLARRCPRADRLLLRDAFRLSSGPL